MGAGVGSSVETVKIRVLGTLSAERDGEVLKLPKSRKVRALLGFLALARAPVGRARLCDLLWDAADDPRAELRWCLSKIRSVLGPRLVAGDDLVELADCRLDAVEVEAALSGGIAQASDAALAEAAAAFGGDLLAGLAVDSPEITGWLAAQRQRSRALHIAILEELAKRSPIGSEEMFRRLEAWLQLAPFDTHAHEVLLQALIRRGRIREANDHLAVAIRSFEQEGLDWMPLRESWRVARSAVPVIEAAAPVSPLEQRTRRRGSVAVMPFADPTGRVGNGLTDDVITRLAKLRALFVIARGTVYALAERNIDPLEAGRILDVEYVVSGRVRSSGDRLSVLVELAETREARIVWTDDIACASGEAFAALDQTVDRIVAAIAEEIEAAESQRAVLKAPASLDAWEAYHRGLWHMYRFNGPDNREAAQFFRNALTLDPTFARAHAGLSFTHFQNAFLGLTADREQQIEQAYVTANTSLAADDRDPAAHWAMGRALWLRGAQSESVAELERSVDLSPNFALGHYTLGFVQSQQGDPNAAIAAIDRSRTLSPFDPLQFGMLASRALAHARLGELDQAADWAVKATSRPNAHAHILAVAAGCLALADRQDEARAFAARIRRSLPSYGIEDFLGAFRLDPEIERQFRARASTIGF
jgi:DNA-binding SARP family transcriptional activator/Tfp pilus assembly protein PilF